MTDENNERIERIEKRLELLEAWIQDTVLSCNELQKRTRNLRADLGDLETRVDQLDRPPTI